MQGHFSTEMDSIWQCTRDNGFHSSNAGVYIYIHWYYFTSGSLFHWLLENFTTWFIMKREVFVSDFPKISVKLDPTTVCSTCSLTDVVSIILSRFTNLTPSLNNILLQVVCQIHVYHSYMTHTQIVWNFVNKLSTNFHITVGFVSWLNNW